MNKPKKNAFYRQNVILNVFILQYDNFKLKLNKLDFTTCNKYYGC